MENHEQPPATTRRTRDEIERHIKMEFSGKAAKTIRVVMDEFATISAFLSAPLVELEGVAV